jgi:hypothetical protein
MMSNYLIALAIAGAMSVPALSQPAQSNPSAPTTNPAQAVKPQMIKKLICEDNDNPYSHINRVCHTVMVPAQPAGPVPANQQVQKTAPRSDSGN